MKKIISILSTLAMLVSMTACGSTNTANQSDLEYIKDKGTLVIGYTLFSPMNFKDENNELVGFETEFGKLVCEKIGVTPEFQEIDWSAKEVELNAKNIDCIWNGMTITEERQANMSISDPYMENRQVMIVRAADKEKYTNSIAGANVVAEKGSAGEELVLADELFKDANYTALDSQAKAVMEVKSGTSDICLIDYVMATGTVGEGTDYEDLTFIDKDFESETYGIAFRKGSDVTAEVNKAIDELIAEGKLQEVAEKYKLGDLLIVE